MTHLRTLIQRSALACLALTPFVSLAQASGTAPVAAASVPAATPVVGTVFPHVPGAAGHPEFPVGVPHGSVHVHRYFSAGLNREREMWVYTPPGYADSAQRYPLLVLQHAGADTQKTWVTKGNVDWLLDQLIAAGQARPMVVIMLAGHPKGERVYLKPETRVEAMHDLQNELFNDAIPLVEAQYRVEKARELRGLAGPSVGGGQLISIGLSNLDRFAWLGVFSAGHAIPEFYEPALQTPAKVNEQLKLFWISCATGDDEYQNNQAFVAKLTKLGVRHEWYPTEGAHDWPVWRRDLARYLMRVFQMP